MKSFLVLAICMAMLAIQLTSFAQTAQEKQILVYFQNGIQKSAVPNEATRITSSAINSTLSSYGINASNITPAFPRFNEAKMVAAEKGEESRTMNYSNVYIISLPDMSAKKALMNDLSKLPEVLYVESNGNISDNLIPVDGRFGFQWNMRNQFVPGADIHAEPAWDIFTGNPNAIIAVIDNGVDINHNDLNGKILGGDNTFQIDVDNFGRQISHGSHVAGIAGATTNNNNNNGVAGVDWQARLHPKNIFDGNGDPDITQSLLDALNFSPDVWTFNNSWSLTNPGAVPGRYSITVRSAFAQIYRANRVQCAAMGNFQQTNPGVVGFPVGFNTGLIAVGATNMFDDVTNFSANGAHIDVAAPGEDVESTNFNNNYIDMSGTSMATPHVSGLASLLKGFNTNLANDDIEQIIRLTTDDVNAANGFPGFDNQLGTGRINAQRALQTLQAPNQVLHLNVTGGTVVNTSGNESKTFLGVPGFADAVYVIRRSEVQTAVTFPVPMCTLFGAWGRGVGTTGWREEANRLFGEGICEVVPGTLTNTGATLRTWIYEIWGINGQYYGFYPRSAGNVVFQYTVLGVPQPNAITGDDHFCATSNNYSAGNLPPGATIQWQVNPSWVATVDCPTCPQTTLTRSTDGTVTLTAIISNACGGQQITLNRQNIRVGNAFPQGTTFATSNWNYYNGPLLSSYSFLIPSGQSGNAQFNISDPSYSSIQWTPVSVPSGTSWSASGNSLNISASAGGSQWSSRTCTVRMNAQGPCGPYVMDFSVSAVNRGSSFAFSFSPNPANSQVTVTAERAEANSKSVNLIYGVKILDQFGAVRKKLEFKHGILQTKIPVEGLSAGLYLLSVFDGKEWKTKSLIIQK